MAAARSLSLLPLLASPLHLFSRFPSSYCPGSSLLGHSARITLFCKQNFLMLLLHLPYNSTHQNKGTSLGLKGTRLYITS